MTEQIKIKKIEIISFGKLKDTVLRPSDGLNLMTLPNESGKSTLAAFIKFVFYGFSGGRRLSLSENEKQLYSPWDGNAAEGYIILETSSGEICVERSFYKNKETVMVTDTTTGKDLYKDEIPGNAIFGIDEDTFTKSLFFKQLSPPPNGDPDLAAGIRNLMFSGDEKVNGARAEKRLKEAKAALMNSQKKGIIPSLEEKRRKTAEDFTKAEEINRELMTVYNMLDEKKQRIAFNRKKLTELEAECQNARRYLAKKRLEEINDITKRRNDAERRYLDAKSEFIGDCPPDTEMINGLINDNAEYTRCEKKLEELNFQIDKSNNELSLLRASSVFFDKSPDTAKTAIKKSGILYPVFLVLAAVLIAAGVIIMFLQKLILSFVVIALGVVCLVAGFVFFLRPVSLAKQYGFSGIGKLKKGIEEFAVLKVQYDSKKELTSSLEKGFGTVSAEFHDIKDSLDKRINRFVARESAGKYADVIQKMLDSAVSIGTLKADFTNYEERLASLTKDIDIAALGEFSKGAQTPPRELDAASRELDFIRSQTESLGASQLELEKKASALRAVSPDPAVLKTALDSYDTRLAALKIKYNAVTSALSLLGEASDYMCSTVSPKLAEIAGGYMEIISGGKYSSLSLTTDLVMSYSDDKHEKSVDYLSGGAKDSVYMCLRFAVTELLFSKKHPFMLLDDAFTRLDDTRLKLMLRLINDLSENKQVIMMTCHKRDGELLDEMGIKYGLLRFEA